MLTSEVEFTPFPKMARLNRDIVITEKIDGTNAAVLITDEYDLFTQSRKRLITPDDDNFGFAKWAQANADGLKDALGPGLHFGEWWGSGIQRGYGLPKGEKRFSLFNTTRWQFDPGVSTVEGLNVVPVLFEGAFSQQAIQAALETLSLVGSIASPGFEDPEGVVVFHTAANFCFKVTLQNDESPKSLANPVRTNVE